MIQLDETRAVFKATPAELERAKEQFRRCHAVRLPGFLAPGFLAKILSQLKEATFAPKAHDGIGHELVCWDSPATDTLLFVHNDPHLFRLITELSGVGPIGCFLGRIYRMTAESAHHEAWHSDVGAFRLMALSINISDEPYQGGTTILREQGRPETEQRLDNPTPGDAILFRIDPTLEHAITDVEPGPPKTAWAGWFRSEPSFLDVLAGKAQF